MVTKKIAYENYIKNNGMEITILGGSTMPNYFNGIACGYIIKTYNGKLIIVDGGNDTDIDFVYDYINKIGNGTVDYWIVTHLHSDHIGALCELLESDKEFKINNLCYSILDRDWYEKYDERGFETESQFLDLLADKRIINKYNCKKDDIFNVDNVKCEIIRVANPEIIYSDNGNDASMTFKLIATDSNKSMIFLGDSFVYASQELLKESEKLKADAVQMAHHGQNGVTKEVYDAINPDFCFFNTPIWLWNNDAGRGTGSGGWKTLEVRKWCEEYGAQTIISYNGDQTYRFSTSGIYQIPQN